MSKSGSKKEAGLSVDGYENPEELKLNVRVLLPDSPEAKKREASKPLYLTRYE